MPLNSKKSNRDFVIDKAWLRESFTNAATSYNQVAVLQQEVAKRLIERLDYIKLVPESQLDLGSGTGYCSNMLLARYPKAALCSMDIALGMLTYARAQKSWLHKWRHKQSFICADAEALPIGRDSMDLVVSSLALQWCFDLTAVFTHLQQAIKPGGLFMFATMGPDTLKELRQSWASSDNQSHVSGFYDMHDIGDSLLRAGFSDPVMDVEHIKLTYSQVKDLMGDLKKLGSRNAVVDRSRGLTGKHKFQQMLAAYEEFRTDDGLPATYEIVFGHAWVPENKNSLSLLDNSFPIPVVTSKG